MSKMKLSEDLQWRGLIKDTTFKDTEWLDDPKTFYLGIDCSSANSLTIGNLAVLLLAKRLKQAGWKTVLLVGGATSLIGDPGGKEEERELKSREEIKTNVVGIEAQIKLLFSGLSFELVDNFDWFKDINYLEFLREVGKNYSMTELLQRDFIASRIGEDASGISYAEFSYSLIQGYDYWYLFKHYGVVLQIGGSDQWGNMLSGAPLIRKKENKEVQALSMPLVIDQTTGKKFGKSEAGAVWLDPLKTSPFSFYQFWVNVNDIDLSNFLKIYTELDKDTIEEILKVHLAKPAKRQGQLRLAEEVTTLVHGKAVTEKIKRATRVIIDQKTIGEIDQDLIVEVKKELTFVRVKPGADILETLLSGRLASSKGEARRLLQEGAIYVNGETFDHEKLSLEDFSNGHLLLRRGKAYKDTVLVELDK